MALPNWIKNNTWQWIIGTLIAIAAIVAPLVLSKQGGDIQVFDSPGATVITNKTDPEELAKQDTILQNTEDNKQVLKRIQEQLVAKKIEADPQLVNELKDKIQELEKELEERAHTTKDKRTEDALAAFKSGNYEKAKDLYGKLRKEEKGKEVEHAKTAYNLGNVYFVELDFQNALYAYLDAVRLSPENSTYLSEVGKAYYTLAQYDKVIEYHEKALKSDINTFGEGHSNVTASWNNLGLAWQAKGEYDKAIVYLEKALKSDINTFGKGHPKVSTSWSNLGMSWYHKGNNDKAIEYYEKALESDLKTFGEDHLNVATSWNGLGLAWQDKGDNDKAIVYLEKALRSVLKTFDGDHPNVATGRHNLGSAWFAKGEYDKAIEYYEMALKSVLNMFGDDHPDVASNWNSLGLAWQAKGEYDKAIEYFEKALKCFKKAGLHHHAKTVEDSLEYIRYIQYMSEFKLRNLAR